MGSGVVREGEGGEGGWSKDVYHARTLNYQRELATQTYH